MFTIQSAHTKGSQLERMRKVSEYLNLFWVEVEHSEAVVCGRIADRSRTPEIVDGIGLSHQAGN